jgi:hypothetical protein
MLCRFKSTDKNWCVTQHNWHMCILSRSLGAFPRLLFQVQKWLSARESYSSQISDRCRRDHAAAVHISYNNVIEPCNYDRGGGSLGDKLVMAGIKFSEGVLTCNI